MWLCGSICCIVLFMLCFEHAGGKFRSFNDLRWDTFSQKMSYSNKHNSQTGTIDIFTASKSTVDDKSAGYQEGDARESVEVKSEVNDSDDSQTYGEC